MVVVSWNTSEFYQFNFLLLKIYAISQEEELLGCDSEFSEPPNTVELAWMSLSIYLS